MFQKVLIANRGEIAVRIIRACHSFGIQTVMIYAEDDRQGLAVKLADEAYLLPGSTLAETYLNISAIVEIAKRSGAEAVHPGYGFLSENPLFVEACQQAGLRFMGPDAEVMRKMGSKVEARKHMQAAGVPVTPGSPPLNDASEAETWAQKIGYPILLKASAGGGGRGMKKVSQASELTDAFAAARREGETYFSDGTIYMEKFVEKPRHVEVQILGDRHGNVIHLGERDCSVQRRNQKLVEESPAPHLPAEVRDILLTAAVKGAKALNYTGAGTFEFVVQNNRDVYFMEVNTRLQVEHPVTEMVTGRDLVREQLRIAAGLPISFAQEEVQFHGSAIECRITIEDAQQNFRPVPGKVGKIKEPCGPWVRVDSMLQADYEIPGSYDSLVAKLIVWGADREEAITRLRQALKEYTIEGVTTLIPFFQWITNEPHFVAGHFDTHYLENYFSADLLEAPTVIASEKETPASVREIMEMEVNGKRFEVAVYREVASSQKKNRPGQGKKEKGMGGNPDEIRSPMAGTLVKVNLSEDQQVEKGSIAFVIESMKMENDILTAREGKVAKVMVNPGQKVQAGDLLMTFA
jgi:acetyl-CoA/propionyl-CoA carboxylase, biotin carboxylase, biotin carboxyl carrier protein